MEQLLRKISESAIKLADFEFTQAQVHNRWLGNEPASLEAIAETETRLGFSLPEDYKTFLKICNGFSAANVTEPSFLPVEKISPFNNAFPEVIQQWIDSGNLDVGTTLKTGLLVAELDQEQFFLLIPPSTKGNWQYWKFAFWIPGEEQYDNLVDYWNTVLEFNLEEIQEK